MSYLTQSRLEQDPDFQQRVRAVNTQQSAVYLNDARPDFVACARAVLRDEPGPGASLLRFAAAGPGIADKVDTGGGIIDQSLVTDEDLLSLTQTNFPAVVDLYFNEDGTPVPTDNS